MVSQYNVRLWKTRVDRGSGRRLSEGSETFNQSYTNIEVFGSYQNTLVEHENITKGEGITIRKKYGNTRGKHFLIMVAY